MSGDAVPNGPARPIELTDDDVEQLAGDRRSRVAVLTRLKAEVPSGPVGSLETRLDQPAKVSKAELASMQESGRLPERVAARLTVSESPADASEAVEGPQPDAPTEVPPSARRPSKSPKRQSSSRS
jgi:hypothetical protein